MTRRSRSIAARLSLVLVAAATVLASAESAQRRPIRKLDRPKAAIIAGYADADCVDVSPSVRLCKAIQKGGLFDGECAIALILNGAVVKTWQSSSPLYRGMFDVRLGDLDSDGRDELIVVDHLATSNGSAMTIDQAIVVSSFSTPDSTSVNFEIDEYCGPCGEGTFVERPGHSGIWIFATEWMSSEVLDPKRGYGNYVVGRWLRYQAGKLALEPGVLIRRYLNSFSTERGEAGRDTPYAWFLNGKGRLVATDPAIGDGRVIESRTGVIDTGRDARGDASYVVQLDDGTRSTFGPASGPIWDRSDAVIGHVGLLPSGRVLPMGVTPDAVLGEVHGRRVRFDTYRDGRAYQRVMWIR